MEFQYFLTLTTKMEVAFFYDKMENHFSLWIYPNTDMKNAYGCWDRWAVALKKCWPVLFKSQKKIVLGSRRNTEIFHVIKWVNKKSDFKLVS